MEAREEIAEPEQGRSKDRAAAECSHSKAGAEESSESKRKRRRKDSSRRGASCSNLSSPKGLGEEPALAPGEGATTVHALAIWTDVFSLLVKIKSRLAAAFHSARTKPSAKRAPSGEVWPCPLPFPELHRRKANRLQRDGPRKLALNFVVLVMNMFHHGQGHFAGAVPGLGTPLNFEQWQFVKNVTPLVDQWNRGASCHRRGNGAISCQS